MQTQRIAELPAIGTCAECLSSGVLNDEGHCNVCAARTDAYREGQRQAALESLYAAADNLLAAGWDLAQICQALNNRPECAIEDFAAPSPRLAPVEIDEYADGTPRRDWTAEASREMVETVAPAMREAAERLGADDAIGAGLGTLAFRWEVVAQAHLSAALPVGR